MMMHANLSTIDLQIEITPPNDTSIKALRFQHHLGAGSRRALSGHDCVNDLRGDTTDPKYPDFFPQ